MAEYFLMHKNIPVCLMEIDDNGNIGKVRRSVENMAHFPLGGQMNNMKFHEWWRDRAIPKTRHGAKSALNKLGYSSTASALVNNLALSLSDCYWICPREEHLTWEEVNLFTNDFVDSFGEITINNDYIVDLRDRTKFSSATSQGELQKKWCIDKSGRRYLIKGNYGNSYQQSLNEIFATDLHEKQRFDNYTKYSLGKLTLSEGREGLGCLSYDFCSENLESISAWELLQTVKLKQNESYYYSLKEVCMGLGMSEAYFNNFMDYEIISDFLITNIDRHMNNIAVVRDPDTLELKGFAPIYDSGNSMFYNLTYEELQNVHLDKIKTHSFIELERRLLQYVHNREILDLNKLNSDFSIYDEDIYERHARIPKLKELFERKVDALAAFQSGKDIWKEKR